MSTAREEWLKRRMNGLGGTDIAAIAGFSAFANAYDVYCQKLGLVPSISDSVRLRAGRAMEPVCAELYQEETGFQLLKIDDEKLPIFHRDYSWAFASPDRLVLNEAGDTFRILECKSVHSSMRKFWGGDWSDDIPKGYWIQGMWYMECTEQRECDYSAVFGNSDKGFYRIKHNPEAAKALIKIGEDFMENHILPQIPPEIGDTASNAEAVKALYPSDDGTSKEATNEIIQMVCEYVDIGKVIKDNESRKRELKSKITDFMGTAQLLTGPGLVKVTYKSDRTTEKVDWKGICADLDVSYELRQKFTTEKVGARRFLPKIDEGLIIKGDV